jgi:hypothetical protein
LNKDLEDMISKRDAPAILRYIKARRNENDKEYILSIHEMFLIAKYVKDTDMSGRKKAAKELLLTSLISDAELLLLTDLHAIVNKYMKEKGWRKAVSTSR